jgi:hypothetical protein
MEIPPCPPFSKGGFYWVNKKLRRSLKLFLGDADKVFNGGRKSGPEGGKLKRVVQKPETRFPP